jgi:hypothetical protein
LVGVRVMSWEQGRPRRGEGSKNLTFLVGRGSGWKKAHQGIFRQ